MATFLQTINTADPKFLKEYDGKYIQSPEGIYQVSNGTVNTIYTKAQMDALNAQSWDANRAGKVGLMDIGNQAISFTPTSGLAPAKNPNDYKTSEAFRYYNTGTVPQEQIATNFGMGTQPDFRPRGANESTYDYLQAKQAAGNTGIQAGINPATLTPNPDFKAASAGQSATGASSIYGTPQELSDKYGYQISGGQVYSNGQVIGTYGGVSPSSSGTTGGTPTSSGTTATSTPNPNFDATKAITATNMPYQTMPGYTAPPNQQMPGYIAPPNQQTPGYTAPPTQNMPGYVAPPNAQMPGYVAPPSQALPGYTPPPNQVVAGYQAPPAQQVPGYVALPTLGTPNYTAPPSPGGIPTLTTPDLTGLAGSNTNPYAPTITPRTTTPGTLGAGDVTQPTAGQMQGDLATQFNTFRGLLDSMTRESYNNKPGVSDLVNVFKQQIQSPGVTDPSIVGNLVDKQKTQQLGNVSDIYRQTLRTLNTMETTRTNQINKGQETLMNLGQMGLLGQVTGQEYDQIMKGEIPMTVLQKMSGMQEQDMVNNLISKYPTAGIQMNDTMEIASQKIGNLQNKELVIDFSTKYPEAGINLKDSYEMALTKIRIIANTKSEYEKQLMEAELKNNYNIDLWNFQNKVAEATTDTANTNATNQYKAQTTYQGQVTDATNTNAMNQYKAQTDYAGQVADVTNTNAMNQYKSAQEYAQAQADTTYNNALNQWKASTGYNESAADMSNTNAMNQYKASTDYAEKTADITNTNILNNYKSAEDYAKAQYDTTYSNALNQWKAQTTYDANATDTANTNAMNQYKSAEDYAKAQADLANTNAMNQYNAAKASGVGYAGSADEKNDVRNVMYRTPEAGITQTDTYDSALAKEVAYNAKLSRTDIVNKYQGAGYTYITNPADLKNYTADQIERFKGADGVDMIFAKPAAKASSSTPKPASTLKQIEDNLIAQRGADGFVSPDDYAAAKADWIKANGAPADFDTKFKNRRNPANPNYKLTNSTSTGSENLF